MFSMLICQNVFAPMVMQKSIRVSLPEFATLSRNLFVLLVLALLTYSMMLIDLILTVSRPFHYLVITKCHHPPVFEPVHQFRLQSLLSPLYQLHPSQYQLRNNLFHKFPNKHFHSIARTQTYLPNHRVIRMLTSGRLHGCSYRFDTELSALPQKDSAAPRVMCLSTSLKN